MSCFVKDRQGGEDAFIHGDILGVRWNVSNSRNTKPGNFEPISGAGLQIRWVGGGEIESNLK